MCSESECQGYGSGEQAQVKLSKLMIIFPILYSVGNSQYSGQAEELFHVLLQGYRGLEKEA